jgi:hypothetical protein
MQIGDVVVPKESYTLLHSGSGNVYECAIVASVSPFVLVSVDGDMLWSDTVFPHEVRPLCQASKPIVRCAVARWERERWEYSLRAMAEKVKVKGSESAEL